MRSNTDDRGGMPIISAIFIAGLLAGGGWLWFESQPKGVEEILPVAHDGPVMVRDFGTGQMFEAGKAPPSPPPPTGAAEPSDGEAPSAAGPGVDATPAPTGGASSAESPSAPAAEAAKPDAGRWEEEIARYEAAPPPAAGGVVMIGASNIRMWDSIADDFAGLAVVNRGVGGCRLSELAEFAPRLLDPAEPAVIVVSAGSNDIHAGATPEEVLDAFRRLLATIRRRHTKVPVVVMGILPAKSRWDERGAQVKANDLVQAAIAALPADMAPVEYLDVGAAFLGADGEPDPAAFLDDDLHPSPLGNARRAAALRPVLERLLGANRPAP